MDQTGTYCAHGHRIEPPALRSVPPSSQNRASAPEPLAVSAGPDPDEARLTDVGNGSRLARIFGERLRWVADLRRWVVWDGRRWKDNQVEPEFMAKETVRAMIREAADDPSAKRRRELLAWAIRSESAGAIAAMLTTARSEPGIAAHVDDFDRDPWLLNVANGVVDLRNGTIAPHRPRLFISKIANVAFDGDATAPRWDRFLEEVQPDPEIRGFLHRAAGYSATGFARDRKLLVLWGTGRNGKGVFLSTLHAVLGDYAKRTTAETFAARRGGTIPNDIAAIRGARLVFAAETGEGRRLDEALVKDLTGGEPISARFMRGEWFSFTPAFTPWLATNHRPEVRGTDEAIWDRLALVPFTVRIDDGEVNPNLAEELRQEAPGILRWIVEGAVEWAIDGLQPPDTVRAATRDYRVESDTLGAFIADRCVAGASEVTSAAALYASYREWCEATGERPVTQRALSPRLAERGLERYRAHGGTWMWKGIRCVTGDGRG